MTFAIWLFESFFEYLFKISWRGLAQEVQHELRIDTYSNMQNLEMAFFEHSSSGNLMSIVNDDVNQLERFLDHGMNDILQILTCLLYTSPSPRDATLSRMPSSA